jgi:hypothetical protein
MYLDLDFIIPLDVYDSVNKKNFTNKSFYSVIEWIPYSRIKVLEQLAEGGFSFIYKAIWFERAQTVAVKRLKNSQNLSKEFLNEVIHLSDNYHVESYY